MFYVATVGQGTASQPGCVRTTDTLCRNSVALCCVATENATRARQTRPDAHDKTGHSRLSYFVVTEISLSRQTSYNSKKKKTPWDWGVTITPYNKTMTSSCSNKTTTKSQMKTHICRFLWNNHFIEKKMTK